ncbi:hypothetical protein SBA2_670038 [Acidobacteriia bacterium SbA2]|nr:hypothetical protein SBA2_670038 [Acidobacteriia bacterium SbA2]
MIAGDLAETQSRRHLKSKPYRILDRLDSSAWRVYFTTGR